MLEHVNSPINCIEGNIHFRQFGPSASSISPPWMALPHPQRRTGPALGKQARAYPIAGRSARDQNFPFGVLAVKSGCSALPLFIARI
ncbi:hypothetical protein [Chitiniphilus shinanonensis]|uniref:hypothetical protein n=1 Tax=Chitiniphilus shinanonensis TaxID=553088 RepID=UPI0012FA88B2|nr:hypothetical protein [Chitiniphilus shinanonensis]